MCTYVVYFNKVNQKHPFCDEVTEKTQKIGYNKITNKEREEPKWDF